MSADKALESKSAKDAVDEVSTRVHQTIQKAGAEASIEVVPHNPTMRALLDRYTQSHTLTERDEDGEHPLFPQSRSRGRAEQRSGHGDGVLAQTPASSREQKEQLLLSRVLHKIDTEKLTHVKEVFMKNDNALLCKDFVDLLLPNVRSMEGGEEQIVAALQLVHERIGQGVKGEEKVKEATQEEANPAFLTEAQVEDEAQKLVSWDSLAKLLLQEGVVANVLSGFNLTQVLSVIDLEKITPLQAIFEKKGTVDLENFVVIMKGQFQQVFELIELFELYDDERKIINQLVNLFDAIDVDCNGSMTWEEFTAFLVDQGMAEDVPQQYIIRFSQSPLKDGNGHQSHCEKVVYLKGYDKIAFVESGSKCLKLCTPDMQPFHDIKEFTQTPLCAEYINKYNWVAVSCSDLSLSFFDIDNSLKIVRRVETKTAQLVLCWSEAAEVLFSADHEGRILSWSMQKVKFGAFDEGEEKKEPTWRDFMKDEIFKQDPPMRHISIDSHREATQIRRRGKSKVEMEQDQSREERRKTKLKAKAKVAPRYSGENIVMQLLELPVLQQMASCGVDGNVMTWDVFTGMWKRTLRGHEMGVRCMAFATSTKVLVTGGYDYNLFVWNPYVGKSIHTIHGHSAPIVGIEVLGASSNQVVTADSEGFVKSWDLGTYQMIQSFLVDDITILRAFVSIPSSKRVIAVDREFVAFDYQNTGIADQTEEEPLIKVFYNERLKVFVSGTINLVKIWDAVTGLIKVSITHKDAEITDFCFDDRGRKLFVSDHLGRIHVYHSSTGCLVKKLTGHSKEVSGLIYCPGDRNIISVSWDRSIVVHDESAQEVVHRRATNSHKGDITCVAYSRHLGLIATGSTDCVIAVREYLKLRILACLLGHKTDVTALAFVEPYPLLVSADFGGNVAVWAVPTLSGKDHRFGCKVLTRFMNMQSLESSASVNCLDAVTVDEEPFSFVLYTGDEDGEVRSWDVSALIPAAGLQKCPPILEAEWDPYKRVENDASHTAETVARKALEVPELQAQLDQPVVRQGISWKAHSDSLRTLKVYSNPPCVVTAGFDGMAKVWTMEGQLMTVLRAYGQSTWNFPVEATDPYVPLETQNWLLQKVREASQEEESREALGNGYLQGGPSSNRPRGRVRGAKGGVVKHPSDLDKVRQRAKKLYKRYASEKNKFQAKKVMEAFEMVQRNMKKIGEGAYKLIGRGRKERELDRHFHHQAKEIKKDRRIQKTLKQARKGEKRFHLPGDKERIPSFRRKKRRRRHMPKPKKPNVDVLQGLERLATVLPQKSKFPKVVKLLYRWTKEYMNVDNREYIFRVLNDLTKLPFLTEDKEGRQDVICVFEYVLTYNTEWFEQDDKHNMLGRAWKLATVLWCQCFTDDAFTLSSTISKLNEAFNFIEEHKDALDGYLEEKQRKAAKHEAKVEAKLDPKIEAKMEAKEELEEFQANGKMKWAEPVEPGSSNGHVKPKEEASDGEDFFGGGADDEMSEEEECSDDDDDDEISEEKAGKKARCIDLDSDAEGGEISSDDVEEESVEVSSSSEAEDLEMETFVFPVPNLEESLLSMRKDFVHRCLFALFRNRGPLWARQKVDTFFQDIFYRRGCLDKEQQTQVEAWQSRIKVLQKESEHKVGEANNILEAHRPVVDSREMRQVVDADSNAWSAKQTFDSREKSGARHVIR